MTTPQDPYANPGGDASQPSQGQPGYGQPPGGPGQQPGYGPPPGQGGFGAPPSGWDQQQPQKSGTNGLAIASLVTAFLCSPLGIILGFVAKGQIKKTGQSGDGLATAGIAVGIALIALNILLISLGAFSA